MQAGNALSLVRGSVPSATDRPSVVITQSPPALPTDRNRHRRAAVCGPRHRPIGCLARLPLAIGSWVRFVRFRRTFTNVPSDTLCAGERRNCAGQRPAIDRPARRCRRRSVIEGRCRPPSYRHELRLRTAVFPSSLLRTVPWR
jgi:hypothetical protein